MTLFKLLHIFCVVVWVGGMFFAYAVLRPSAVETLDPPPRLRLWNAVFGRFFKWVWAAIAGLLVSGFYMIELFGGIARAAPHVHAMMGLGLSMISVYSYVYFACYKPMSAHIAAERWQEAGCILANIRKLVALNLGLGILTLCAVELLR